MSLLAAFAVPHPPIILPEIGRGEEKKIAQTTEAYEEAMKEAAALKPETVIITSPHATCYYDYFHISPGAEAQGDFGRFNAPEVKIKAAYDTDVVRELTAICEEKGISAGTSGEKDPSLDHGTMIPLYFLQKFAKDFKIVRIGLSGLPPLEGYRLGKAIAEAAEKLQRRVVLIASGDLSHCLKEDGPYGFNQAGPVFDREITAQLAQADFRSFFGYDPAFLENAAECGLGSFQIMAGALDKKAVESKLLSYEGPFGVGYGVASFFLKGDDPTRDFEKILTEEKKARMDERKAHEDEYVRLARLTLETYLTTGQIIPIPAALPPEMTGKRAGVFVSLHKDGDLRGCIGTFSPVYKNIADEIIHNAIAAGTEDPRFPQVEASELADLVYSVDVLSPFEAISSSAELDPKRYGVIVQKGSRRGLLLPNLDGVETPEQQIEIAKKKAGITKQEKVSLYRFEAIRHL
jgi:AmmeMemoRadiSam system protein A/AmmeMemoRadiSam system protein B